MTTAPVDTTAAASPPPKRSATRFITPALALVAALGVGIFGGVLIGQNTATTSAAPSGFTPPDGVDGAPAGGGFAGAGGGFTSGEITSVDGDTVTLTLDDGSTVTVTTSSDTTVSTAGTVSDLSAGDTVTVIGEADDSGNVTATAITEGTGGFGGFGGGAPPTDQG